MRPTTNHPISSPKTNGHSSYPGMTKRSPTLLSNASDDDQDEEEVDLVQNGAEQNGSNSERKGHLDTRHWFQNVEDIQVTVAPEREGFIFKHVNYIVTNEKRSSIVLRRYSDFWWLLEVLLRRYPFRSLPNLPPKKLGGRKWGLLL
jgi:hypothetical protein